MCHCLLRVGGVFEDMSWEEGYVVVCDGSVKSHKQKQLLLLNLHELYVASQPP